MADERRIKIPRSSATWALIFLWLGWAPLFFLVPLAVPFPHLVGNDEAAGLGMAIAFGTGPICTLVSIAL